MKLIALLSVLISTFAFACGNDGTGFLPKNSLRIPVGSKMAGGLTQASFNKVIDEIEALMAPEIARHGGNLNVVRNWTDAEVNAFASRDGKTWEVQMFGGLARHPAVTEDGFRLVLCHEIGHHIGGAPLKTGRWAAVEGQADYWGTLKCLREVFQNDNNIKIIKDQTLPAGLKEACEKSFRTKGEQAICIRSGLAGASVAGLFSALEESSVSLLSPDKTKVPKTFEGHPMAQCRMDTFFQGALCKADWREETSDKDEVKGTCHTSLGDKIGTRPLCWYNYVRK